MTLRPRLSFPATILLLTVLSLACANAADEAETEYSLGNAALSRLDFKQALLHYDEVIRLNPEHAGAYLRRGQIRWQTNQYEQSLPDLDRAIELDSSLTWAFFFRGVSLHHVGRLEESIPDLTRVIESADFDAGDQVRALTWRSIALFKLGRFDESIDDLNERVNLEPDQPIHRIDRGGAYQAVGELEKAIEDYRTALRTENLADEVRQIAASRLTDLGEDIPPAATSDTTSTR